MKTKLTPVLLLIAICVVKGSENPSTSQQISKRTLKGGHHFSGGSGTSCSVKGSYCSCHYCKCDYGQIHCHKHGATAYMHGHGKNT